MAKKIDVKKCMKWVVILPIFIIFLSHIIYHIIGSTIQQVETVSNDIAIIMQIESIAQSVNLCIAAIAFLAICFVFKHCIYTWITTVSFALYELIGLSYAIFIYDYDIYAKLENYVCILGICALIGTYTTKKIINHDLG